MEHSEIEVIRIQIQLTCREHTSHTKYRLPSFPVGVLAPVALSLAAANSLLAAEEGVAAREDAFAGITWVASPVKDPGR